jgi:hypothetical protein
MISGICKDLLCLLAAGVGSASAFLALLLGTHSFKISTARRAHGSLGSIDVSSQHVFHAGTQTSSCIISTPRNPLRVTTQLLHLAQYRLMPWLCTLASVFV